MAEDLKENLFSPKCRVPERRTVVDLFLVQSGPVWLFESCTAGPESRDPCRVGSAMKYKEK